MKQKRTREQAMKTEQFARKDALFASQVASGIWPADTCPNCTAVGHCHLDFGHHLYDCCTHCGNDERNIRLHSYRGGSTGKQAARALRTLESLIALSDELDRADTELAEEIARLERA
jgi:hypothetical protein